MKQANSRRGRSLPPATAADGDSGLQQQRHSGIAASKGSSHSRGSKSQPPDTAKGDALTAQMYAALMKDASSQAESIFGRLDEEIRRLDHQQVCAQASAEDAAAVRALPDSPDSDSD